MKRCNIIIIIICIILIIISIYITYVIKSEEPCHPTWEAVVDVKPLLWLPLRPEDHVYALYEVTVTTDRNLKLELKGRGFPGVTTRTLIPEAEVSPGETVLYDSLEIIVDTYATPVIDVVCVDVNESGCEIPVFSDCIPVQIASPAP
jgi:hypothetical protein